MKVCIVHWISILSRSDISQSVTFCPTITKSNISRYLFKYLVSTYQRDEILYFKNENQVDR